MPFQSSKQRAYLFSKKPDVAEKFAAHEDGGGKKGPNQKPSKMGRMARIALRRAKASRSAY